MNLALGLTHLFDIFPSGLVCKRYTSNAYESIDSDGSLIKFDTISYLIKEGYFNLNTILNLKSLWMPQV
jgi:hypothetical protein